jgi:hypothetical protein
LIAEACFVNEGGTVVDLIGTTEPETVTRSATTIGGKSVAGDIALTFLGAHSHSLLEELGVIAEHASNLTDGLLPPWLLWLLAIVVAFGVPSCVVAALYLAVRVTDG